MKPEQIDMLEDFTERARKAQATIDSILQKSDRKARARPRARSTDPHTSQVAARKAGENLTSSQRAVLECATNICSVRESFTDPELIAAYRKGMYHAENVWPYQSESGIRTRRHELVEKPHEKIVAAGETEGPGRKFTLWKIKRENT